MKPSITVIGSANVDYIMQVPHLPAKGETVMDASFFQAFGGKGANQAVAAARAGGEITFVGALGNDATAKVYLEGLKADGLNTDHVSMERDTAGGSALIMFDGQGDNYLSVAPGANACVTPERADAAEEVIAAADCVVLQMEIPLETNERILELAAKHETPVILNYAPANNLGLKPSEAIHGLVVNELEAAALAGEDADRVDSDSAGALADRLRKNGGHQFVVITLGKDGSVFADAAGVQRGKAFVVDAVDTTAAGDTFCGALAVALGEGRSLADAVRFAAGASALSVMQVGAQSSIPRREAIESFLK
ncbi:ribokinase [Kiritimatiellaeota bacterium B1221]|nr:ribokinase [Kiritimatiellaeota bacterium B1221]